MAKTMTDREFAEYVRQECIRLAGVFGAIAGKVDEDSLLGRLAYNGGTQALSLCTLAAQQNIDGELLDDVAALGEGGYDLAALATAPPATLDD